MISAGGEPIMIKHSVGWVIASGTVFFFTSASLAAQAGQSKEVHRAAAPYAKEESSFTNPDLGEKEGELRGRLAKQPDSPDLLYHLALVLRQEGKPHESLDTYTRA